MLASLAGPGVLVSGLELPTGVLAPFELLGQVAIPVMVLVFGMPLDGGHILLRGGDRGAILLATVVRFLFTPLAAAVIGHFVLGMAANRLLAPVLCAAPPRHRTSCSTRPDTNAA
ncbi:hypothetical protein [Streptomyces sp. NPDC055681]